MKRLLVILLMFLILPTVSASADWRWASPKFKVKRIKSVCSMHICRVVARIRTREIHLARIKHYNSLKLSEWKMWISLPIPDCTWYGESGTGPQYAKARYTMPNSTGSGAYGKYQLMPSTYSSVAKYGDWSPLDQEIAARREFWRHGIFPWVSCTG